MELLFGHGDDDFPFWLATVRINILLLVAAWIAVGAWWLAPARSKRVARAAPDLATVAALTAIAGALRLFVVPSNLFDQGGIAYSRLLLGYKGHFATAQFFSLVYRATARDLEHAIAIDRLLGTLTVPIVYLLCRALAPRLRIFPAIAAGLLALCPLHILFSASDVLSIFSLFLSSLSYLLIAGGVTLFDDRRAAASLHYLAGFLGLALLTQARYENVLLLIPVAAGLRLRRRDLQWIALAPALVVFLTLGVIYAHQMVASGVSYNDTVRLATGARVALHDLLLNRFLSVPLFLVGAIAAAARRRSALGFAGLAGIVAALALVARTADLGHHGARIYSNWLVVIVVGCGYGFALLWSEGPRWGKIIAGTALIYFGVQPIMAWDRLTTQYLEMQEHTAFKAALGSLPSDVALLVVPDDDLMRRQYHSTFEALNKYLTIAGDHPRIEGITDFLERPADNDCNKTKCAFFAGLPCLEQDSYPFTRDQCERLIAERHATLLREQITVGAPFAACSIYLGSAACASATRPRRFATYRIGN